MDIWTYEKIIESARYQLRRASEMSPSGHLLDKAQAVWIITPDALMTIKHQSGHVMHNIDRTGIDRLMGIPIREANPLDNSTPPILLVMPPRLV